MYKIFTQTGWTRFSTALKDKFANYSNVENKSSATIRSEITSKNVTDGLGFTPVKEVSQATIDKYTALGMK